MLLSMVTLTERAYWLLHISYNETRLEGGAAALIPEQTQESNTKSESGNLKKTKGRNVEEAASERLQR